MQQFDNSVVRRRSVNLSPNPAGSIVEDFETTARGTLVVGEFRSRRMRPLTNASSPGRTLHGTEELTDAPTVVLIPNSSRTTSSRPSFFQVPPSPSPLHSFSPASSPPPPPPSNCKPLCQSLNPPPPIAITVSSASGSEAICVKASSIKSLPRLPTPDFTSLRSRPYKETLMAPLAFLRRGFSSEGSALVSGDRHETLHAPSCDPSQTLSQPAQRRTQGDMRRIDSATSDESQSTVNSAQSRSSESECSIRLVPRLPNKSRFVPRSHRHDDLYDDDERETFIYRSDLQDKEHLSFSDSQRKTGLRVPPTRRRGLTSPNLGIGNILPVLQQTSARFTQKFPSWGLTRTQQVRFQTSEGPKSGSNKSSTHSDGLYMNSSRSYTDGGAFGMEKVARWSGFKWVLIFSVATVFVSGICALLVSIYTWFGAWPQARSVTTVDYDIIIFLTLAGTTLVLTSLLGIAGTLLNSRPILAFYSLLLWPSLVSVLIVGYTSYRRRTFNLEGKLSEGWSRIWDDSGRAIIQDTFRCCGFYSPSHDFALTKTCYPRAPLPGCKGRLFRFEKFFLQKVYTIIFSTAPIHIANIVISLLCSNHVNKTFGKGLTPKAYRLSLADVKANAETIMAKMSETHIPDHPEWTREKKVKDFLVDHPPGLLSDDPIYAVGEDEEWEKLPFEDGTDRQGTRRSSSQRWL